MGLADTIRIFSVGTEKTDIEYTIVYWVYKSKALGHVTNDKYERTLYLL